MERNFFKTVSMLLAASTLLFAQKDDREKRPLFIATSVGGGFKFEHTPIGYLGDITNKTVSSLGVGLESRLFIKPEMAIRLKVSLERWGNPGWSGGDGTHLRGTDGDRAYVESASHTLGFMYYPKSWRKNNGSGGYFSIEASDVRWYIDSTYPPLSNQRYSKGRGGLFLGYDLVDGIRSGGSYFEIGAEVDFLNVVPINSNKGSNPSVSLIIVWGWKFF